MIIETSAPTRIDLAGGTMDIWPLYLFHDGASTLNAAISLRAHVQIEPHDDGLVARLKQGVHNQIIGFRSASRDQHIVLARGRTVSPADI